MGDFTTTRTVDSFKVGDRIAVHPVTDQFMRGLRYGTIEKVGRSHVLVRLEYMGDPQGKHLMSPQFLRPVDADDA